MKTRGGLWAAAAAVLVTTMTVAGCAAGAAPGEPGEGSATPRATPAAAASTLSATPTPEASATPTPAPGADPLAEVDTIVFTAAQLSLLDGNIEVGTVPLVGGSLDDAVFVLTRVLGAPVADGVPESHCQRAQTRWAWGEFRLGTRDLYADEGTLTFRMEQTSVSTRDGRTVRVQTPSGVAVGDPIAPLVAEVPPESQDTFDPRGVGALWLVFDLVRTEESGGTWFPYGAVAWGEGGIVRGMGGPATLNAQC